MKFINSFPILAVLLYSATLFPQGVISINNSDSPHGNPVSAYLNLNKISTVFRNNGVSDINIFQQAAGFKYPKETGKTAVFQSGMLWGVKIASDPQVRVGGSTYRTGLQGGKIISVGIGEDPQDPHVRIYRVRSDVYPGGPQVDLSVEAIDEGKSEAEIRAQYELDWVEWRGQDGAPFVDIDANNVYNPNIDIPGIKGANQTIWFVANDLDPSLTNFFFGTEPIGIEYQATIWEYKDSVGFDNFFFREYKLINKSLNIFDSMYVSMWSDPDIGGAGDDYVGCDTLLNLGYCYNASATDPIYDPLPPPAIGFDLIRGPLVPGVLGEDRNRNGVDDNNDFGINEKNHWLNGFINLPMTAFYYFTTQDQLLFDPITGSSEGATHFYNFMQGKYGSTGEYFINPITSLPTTFSLPGNPVTGEGWIDGILYGPYDRRLGISTGPFQMAPSDTQFVVLAEIASGAINGTDYLSAIDTLKYYSEIAQAFYDITSIVSIKNQPLSSITFQIYQNYPNPFNPNTVIKFSIAEEVQVNLTVFNILGERVKELKDEKMKPGYYEVEFNASQFASGIYLYTIKAGSFIETKKMVLIK